MTRTVNPAFPAVVLLLLLGAAPGRGPADKLAPCRVPGVEEEVLCGRYEVDEDRAAGTERKIGLNVVVLPATAADAAPDPLVFLAGGGVVPATSYAGYFSSVFPDLRRRRDIVLIDQRGSGARRRRPARLRRQRAVLGREDPRPAPADPPRPYRRLSAARPPAGRQGRERDREGRLSLDRLQRRDPAVRRRRRAGRDGRHVPGRLPSRPGDPGVRRGGLEGLDTSCLAKPADQSFALRADEL